MMSDIHSMLESMAVLKASDLYLNSGAPPTFKVGGELRRVTDRPLEAEDIERLIIEALDDDQQKKLHEHQELDVSLQIQHGGRFRLNIYRQKGGMALVARHIKNVIPTFEESNLPEELKSLIMKDQGLILLVGGTGAGKSSTLATMIDYRNENHQGHILTVEDPIEFIHYHKQSLISQREIGVDTESYTAALKYALREAPDVIVIGEIRDEETAKQALRFAETGHLCVATLHANTAWQAVDRLVNFFPEEAHHRIFKDVASNLVAVVAQRMAKGLQQPRIPIIELLQNSMHIATLIEKGDTAAIKEAMPKDITSRSYTFDDYLFELVKKGLIAKEEAVRVADSQVDLQLQFRMDSKNESAQARFTITDWTDSEANFNQYFAVAVEPRKISIDSEPNIEVKLTHAMSVELRNKNYQVSTINPDLILQYSFGVKNSQTNGANEAYSNLSQEFNDLATTEVALILQFVEVDTNRTVWRSQASRVLTQSSTGLSDFFEHMDEVLATLPARSTAMDLGAGSISL